jgi:hypothetical protein
MRALSAPELLRVWEQGLAQSPVQRALLLLASACPEMPWQTLAELSIGQRDGFLLTLREWTFGQGIQSLATCPACGDRLELMLSVADLRVPAPSPTPTTLSLQVADYDVQFRLPNSLDLAACAAPMSEAASGVQASTENLSPGSHQTLLERCLLSVSYRGDAQTNAPLPPDVINAVTAQMAIADPQAEVQCNLTCPGCGHQWRSLFDIVSFFWSEIHAWAMRLLREVHVLASTYSWSEADILAMHPYRRQFYLEMIGQ